MKKRITYYIFFAVLFLTAWSIFFILEFGNLIIEDVPSAYLPAGRQGQREIPREKPYIPNYSESGEK